MAKPVGLRTEILLTLALLLGAALAFGGVVMLRFMENGLVEERIEQLDSVTRLVAAIAGENQDYRAAIHLLNSLPDHVNCQGWWLYDRNLELFESVVQVASERVSPMPAASRYSAMQSKEVQSSVVFPTVMNLFAEEMPRARFAAPVIFDGRFSGLIEFSYSLDDIRQKMAKTQQLILIYVVLYGVVLVAAGYFLLQRNVIAPARKLLKATEDVSHGNLETRLPTFGPVEISQLSEAYNRMVVALQASRQETRAQIETLEKTNRELQRARNDLIRSEKLASVGQLAAGLAHELGNPLAALIGYLELLKQQLVDGQKDLAQRSLAEAERIDFLVRELLDFSRPTGGEAIAPVDIAEELRATVRLLQNQGVFKEIQLIDQLPASLPPLELNRNRLQQVFVNLLLNAAQACDYAGVITLTAGADETIWIAIADNGTGIASENLGKIFDPFFTTKPPGQGTGLGLSISQRIIEGFGGRIEVASQNRVGSRFTVIFLE
ncbi:MAG: two-component sensor histidine kinase [Desulfuromonas sp.]|nr:MAG: two-component sensor histidine kinase [Desulfuromonas sp.]